MDSRLEGSVKILARAPAAGLPKHRKSELPRPQLGVCSAAGARSREYRRRSVPTRQIVKSMSDSALLHDKLAPQSAAVTPCCLRNVSASPSPRATCTPSQGQSISKRLPIVVECNENSPPNQAGLESGSCSKANALYEQHLDLTLQTDTSRSTGCLTPRQIRHRTVSLSYTPEMYGRFPESYRAEDSITIQSSTPAQDWLFRESERKLLQESVVYGSQPITSPPAIVPKLDVSQPPLQTPEFNFETPAKNCIDDSDAEDLSQFPLPQQGRLSPRQQQLAAERRRAMNTTPLHGPEKQLPPSFIEESDETKDAALCVTPISIVDIGAADLSLSASQRQEESHSNYKDNVPDPELLSGFHYKRNTFQSNVTWCAETSGITFKPFESDNSSANRCASTHRSSLKDNESERSPVCLAESTRDSSSERNNDHSVQAKENTPLSFGTETSAHFSRTTPSTIWTDIHVLPTLTDQSKIGLPIQQESAESWSFGNTELTSKLTTYETVEAGLATPDQLAKNLFENCTETPKCFVNAEQLPVQSIGSPEASQVSISSTFLLTVDGNSECDTPSPICHRRASSVSPTLQKWRTIYGTKTDSPIPKNSLPDNLNPDLAPSVESTYISKNLEQTLRRSKRLQEQRASKQSPTPVESQDRANVQKQKTIKRRSQSLKPRDVSPVPYVRTRKQKALAKMKKAEKLVQKNKPEVQPQPAPKKEPIARSGSKTFAHAATVQGIKNLLKLPTSVTSLKAQWNVYDIPEMTIASLKDLPDKSTSEKAKRPIRKRGGRRKNN